MDPLLNRFYRQYLQQVTNLTYPPSKLLTQPDIQQQIYRYFFDAKLNPFLPTPDYQRRVLKNVLAEIVKIAQDEDDEVSNELMGHMGYLSSLPEQLQLGAVQAPRVLSYFLPDPPSVEITTSTFDDTNMVGEIAPASVERVLIRESPRLLAAGSNVGFRTWEACIRLAYYLCTSQARPTIRGANVLELGAGTGLLSLICSMSLGATYVIATDGSRYVLDGIQENISVNKKQATLQHGKLNMPFTKHLDWTDISDLNDVLSVDGKSLMFDYIFGADIIYYPELLDPLATLLSNLIERFPNCKVLISAPVRNENTSRLWQQACNSRGLAVRNIDEEEDGQWRCPPYRLQTGLFHEQAFSIVIMVVTSIMSKNKT